MLGCGGGGLWGTRPPARALRVAGSPGRWAAAAGLGGVGRRVSEACLPYRGPPGRRAGGRGSPDRRAAPSWSRVAGAPRRARRAAGSWGCGLPGWRVAGRWAVSVGLTDRGVVGLRSLICGVLGCGGGLLGREGVGLLGRWDASGYGASGRRALRAVRHVPIACCFVVLCRSVLRCSRLCAARALPVAACRACCGFSVVGSTCFVWFAVCRTVKPPAHRRIWMALRPRAISSARLFLVPAPCLTDVLPLVSLSLVPRLILACPVFCCAKCFT